MRLLLPIVVFIILVGGYFVTSKFVIHQTSIPTKTPASTVGPIVEELKTFRSSSIMKFSILVPKNFQVEEKFGSVKISTEQGSIEINKNGTNFSDLENYLKDLSKKNQFELVNGESLNIAGLKSLKGDLKSSTNPDLNERIYFIYVDYRVYSISTKLISLFDDLDQIAQSFRYIP